MSIDMYLSESERQAASASKACQEHLNSYRQLQKAINDFALNSALLKGKAYDSAKNFFQSVLYPLVQGGILLTEAVEEAVRKFPEEYVAKVSSGDLKQDELEEKIQQLEQQIRYAEYLQEQLFSAKTPTETKNFQLAIYSNVLENYHMVKRKLVEKLEKLLAFNASSPAIFSEISALEAAVQKGLVQVQTAWNANTGTFMRPKDLSWATFIQEKVAAERSKRTLRLNEIGKEEIINDYIESYNLDRQTAEALYHLQQGILKKAQAKGWDQDDVIFEYNRLLASCVPKSYVSIRWKGICGTVDEKELNKMYQKYGLSVVEIKILVDSVTTQHRQNEVKKDLAHEAIQIAAFTNKNWTPWPSFTNAVHNMARAFNKNYRDDQFYLNEEISFKGDVDSGRYDDSDFNSDLDAINVYQRMKNASIDDIFKVQAQYNDGLRKNTVNRVQEFYQNYGNGSVEKGKARVKEIIENVRTSGSRFISSDHDEAVKKEHQQDFFDYLIRGEKQNVH